ncbi:transposase [Escherichia coli]|nr:transposase [Escherichia coli]
MLPSETMIWQPEFTDKTLSRKPGAVQPYAFPRIPFN